MMEEQAYDVFISHASEDKEVAKPLAEFLRRLGVRVWYDEYSLEIGDSLSESIDAGLAASRCGVVILSQSFFAKPWARRELRGLVTNETATGKTILPIWNGIDVEAVRKVSPTLADRFALSTGRDRIEVIGLKILKVVRPDIFDHLQRWVLWNQKLSEAKPMLKSLKDLKPSPRRHETLPDGLLVRARLVHNIVGELIEQSFDQMVEFFCRDLPVTPRTEIGS